MLKERWFVEPMVAFIVRYNGGREARRIGRDAAEFQLLQACVVRNLQMFFERERKRERAAQWAALRERFPAEILEHIEGQVAA